MAKAPGSGFFTLNPRRKPTNLLLEPAIQLKLPLYLVILTLSFAALLAVHSWVTYGRIFEVAIQETQHPEYFRRVVEAQSSDFLVPLAALAVGYVIAVFVICIAYAHRLVGPMVPFRRHIEALKNGDYGSRIHLRKQDAFGDVAEDLNELAAILEEGPKEPGPA